jgi:cell division protein FtsZ
MTFELKPQVTPAFKKEAEQPVKQEPVEPLLQMQYSEKPVAQAGHSVESKPAMRNGFLSKPANIYSEELQQDNTPVYKEIKPAAQPVRQEAPIAKQQLPKQQEPVRPVFIQPEPEESMEFTLVMKEEVPAPVVNSFQQAIPDLSDEEEQRRRAADRINKLRNISFNMNTNHDVTGEFENVPAYVRRNMELFGSTLTSVENYYSKYTVKKDESSNQANISTINKFLDEKKPD